LSWTDEVTIATAADHKDHYQTITSENIKSFFDHKVNAHITKSLTAHERQIYNSIKQIRWFFICSTPANRFVHSVNLPCINVYIIPSMTKCLRERLTMHVYAQLWQLLCSKYQSYDVTASMTFRTVNSFSYLFLILNNHIQCRMSKRLCK